MVILNLILIMYDNILEVSIELIEIEEMLFYV